jgi:hypothetical protein
MHPNLAALVGAVMLCGTALGQSSREGERPPRPDNASNAAIGGWCDALTGAKKDECLRDEHRRAQEKSGEGRGPGGSCDALIGPERERCVRRGGSIEVRSEGGAAGGATAPQDD